MSVLIDRVNSAVFRDGQMIIRMGSGREIRFPVIENPRLAHGTAEQLNKTEISPYGIHWPELDEDLSFEGLLRGDYGQPGVAPEKTAVAGPIKKSRRGSRSDLAF